MAEAYLDPSLEEILHQICDGVVEEDYESPSPSESINPGSQTEIVEAAKMFSLLEINFDSQEDLVAAVHKTASMEGYVTVIKRSKPGKCVYIGCDRGGKYRDTRMVPVEKRKRSTSSRLIGCPFEIVGRRKSEGWKVEIKNLAHNHVPSRDMSGHPY